MATRRAVAAPDGAGRAGLAAASEAFARLYDVDLEDDPGDLELYEALAARSGGPILELGAGSGRLAVPLARAGWSVTGVDRDPAVIERARRRALAAGGAATARRLTWVEADILGLELGRQGHGSDGGFGLAFIAFNTLLQLGDRAAQAETFRVLARHLRPGGIAVADVWLPDADDLARYDGRVTLAYARRDDESGNTVVKTTSAVHDSVSQTVTLTVIYDEGPVGAAPVRWIREDRLRLVGPDDLRAFAEAAGLEVEVIAGDDSMTPLGPGSDRAIIVASLPANP